MYKINNVEFVTTFFFFLDKIPTNSYEPVESFGTGSIYARLYLFSAVKLTRRSMCDGESTSLFLKECCWKLDAGSTSKSASIELRLSVSEYSRERERITVTKQLCST